MSKKVLEPKLNGGNILKSTNTLATAVERRLVGIFIWTDKEFNRKPWKLMTMNHELLTKAYVDRLYVSRN